MTDSNQTTPAGTPNAAAGRTGACRGRGRGAFFAVALLAGGAMLGFAANKALSHGFGYHWGHHKGYHNVGGFMGGPMGKAATPAEAEERAERMVKHFAIEIDATKEQQEKLAVVAKALAKDMLPLRDRMQSGRSEGLRLMAAEKVDREAIEKLRADQLSNADVMTKRLSAAMADAAEILTPEQRKKLAERIERHREHRGWGKRG